MEDDKIVLITGTSSGVGYSTAILLSKNGFKVYGTSRKPGNKIKSNDFETFQLDVCSDESVNGCIQDVKEREGRIDILINNAGYSIAGAIEETHINEAKSQFETNFFGVVRMVNGVLPIMRQQRSGLIINVSSLAGRISVPFEGFYAASKFALEGYTEALRHELKLLDIDVSLVEPSFLKTNFTKARQFSSNPITDYSITRQRAIDSIVKAGQNGIDPSLVANCILKITREKTPRLRYGVGKDAILLPLVKTFIPAGLFEKGTRRNFSLDEN